MNNAKSNNTIAHLFNLQKNALEKLLNVLNAMGAQYKIILSDGTSYGELEAKEPKKHKPKSTNAAGHRYERGETLVYYKPFLDAMQPGGAEAIPFDRFHPPTLSQNINSYAHSMWGSGNYSATRNDANGTVDVLRYR
ncbi:hypothetical protein UFOVP1193_20 [uncultured Caudovirales phage]|uniref:Uncharacterized protein n=1 Tax=uncultured Caudovirales phage TaxID=2100421 RepID=A0A6J5R5S2_9CAUD|nr:hypothetical protein UFOVP1193_20 [uncultured Caudovirales phage]